MSSVKIWCEKAALVLAVRIQSTLTSYSARALRIALHKSNARQKIQPSMTIVCIRKGSSVKGESWFNMSFAKDAWLGINWRLCNISRTYLLFASGLSIGRGQHVHHLSNRPKQKNMWFFYLFRNVRSCFMDLFLHSKIELWRCKLSTR